MIRFTVDCDYQTDVSAVEEFARRLGAIPFVAATQRTLSSESRRTITFEVRDLKNSSSTTPERATTA